MDARTPAVTTWTAPPPGQPDRLAYVDALRGLAITGVVITHIGSLAGVEGPLRALTAAAGSGVQMFFVVSAFTIMLTLGHSRPEGRFTAFFVKRFFRLFPLYWFGILLYFLIFGLESRGFKPGPEPWHFALHATLTNLLHPLTTTSVVPGGWSISCEMLFYLTVPFWFAVVKDTRGALLALLAMVAVGSTVPQALAQVFDPAFREMDPFIVGQYWRWSFPSQLACFGFGIALYFVLRENRLSFMAGPRWAACLLALAAAIAAVGLLRATPLPTHIVFAAAYAVLAFALARHPFGFIVNRVTVFAGRVSYSAYILHFLVLVYLVPLLRETAGLAPIPAAVAAFVLGMPATLALASVTFRLIEQPSIRMARRLVHPSSAAPVAAPQGRRA